MLGRPDECSVACGLILDEPGRKSPEKEEVGHWSVGSWVTMWTSTGGDSRRKRCTTERYMYLRQSRIGARPKITWVMCLERTNSEMASATLLPFSLTTCAPRFSPKRKFAASTLGFSSRVGSWRSTWTM